MSLHSLRDFYPDGYLDLTGCVSILADMCPSFGLVDAKIWLMHRFELMWHRSGSFYRLKFIKC